MERIDRPRIHNKLYRMMEADITKLYIELELTVPIDPFDVAARLGYVVKRLSEIENASQILEILNVRNAERKDGWSFFDQELNTYVIIVNDIGVEHEERNKFTVMHEIGHIRMGHKSDSVLAEMMANHYAAYALAPSALIYLFECEEFFELIDIFDISDECAYYSFKRYCNWLGINGYYDYEIELIDYYKRKKENV